MEVHGWLVLRNTSDLAGCPLFRGYLGHGVVLFHREVPLAQREGSVVIKLPCQHIVS